MAVKKLNELLDLRGRSAIVTGGAKGIGQGIAYRLAEAGAKVLIADMDEAAAQQTAEDFTQNGWTALAMKVDVSNEQDVLNMVNVCHQQLGSVDVLVNNAGIYPNQPLANMTSEDFQKVIDVNLKGVFLTTKHASDVMKQAGGGKIINVSSIDALHPSMIGLAHYDASKHGVWGFTKNTALELAQHKIWVNAIAPGGIATPGTHAGQGNLSAEEMEKLVSVFMNRIPMHRMGEPDEIGKVALFLASDMSSYMTGVQLVVDGGVLLA